MATGADWESFCRKQCENERADPAARREGLTSLVANPGQLPDPLRRSTLSALSTRADRSQQRREYQRPGQQSASPGLCPCLRVAPGPPSSHKPDDFGPVPPTPPPSYKAHFSFPTVAPASLLYQFLRSFAIYSRLPFSTMDYSRSYSPVPPPCPSPQLQPQPLPTPPVYARRPSLTPSPPSREHPPPPKPMSRSSAAANSESLVFSLKDAIVAGSPSRRRFSEQARSRSHPREEATGSFESEDSFDRRPRTAEVNKSFVIPVSSSLNRKHRRSGSSSRRSADSSLPSSPSSHSLARKRTRSPGGGPVSTTSEAPPPVPPLPPLASKREGRSRSLFARKLSPISIPELGLGLDGKLRSPFTPVSSAYAHRRESHSKPVGSEAAEQSFLNMTAKRHEKLHLGRTSLGDFSQNRDRDSDPLAGCYPIRPTHSLPDIKTIQRRSNNPSFTSRIFRLGTQQLVH